MKTSLYTSTPLPLLPFLMLNAFPSPTKTSSSQSCLSWYKKVWPQQDFNNLCVLGWSPWSHIIGLSHDIGAATLLSTGCYVFGLVPSSYPYPTLDAAKNASHYLDIPTQLLDTAISTKTTAFTGVPWVSWRHWRMNWMRRIRHVSWGRLRYSRCLVLVGHLPVWNVSNGISKLVFLWYLILVWQKLEVRLIQSIDIKTVLIVWLFPSGPLFHSDINNPQGWSAHECLVPDAELSLIDEQGKDATGKLILTLSFWLFLIVMYCRGWTCHQESYHQQRLSSLWQFSLHNWLWWSCYLLNWRRLWPQCGAAAHLERS